MKPQRTRLFIFISSLALVIVLGLQVSWILKTARIKEELFNEKARMVLARTTEALRSDKELCQKLEDGQGKDAMLKVDSLFQHYMSFYNFPITYSFEVIPSGSLQPVNFGGSQRGNFKINFFPDQPGCYQKSLEEVAQNNGMQLKLLFPEKKQFIIKEMGTLFICSVALILVVIFLYWQTIFALWKEKRISEHTADFLNNMTHELKTPLTNIALAGKMILKDPSVSEQGKTRYYSEIIQHENEKLRLQIEQVLGLSALERGEIPLLKTELDLHVLIREEAKSMSLFIENEGGSIELKLDAELPRVLGDKKHLTNALGNLLDNAIKYSSGKPEICILTYNRGPEIILEVSDRGIGIEKEYQKKVFSNYFRVPTGDVHNVKGFGLGLSYVKKIMELHGGKVSLHSEKGKGSTFLLTFTNV